MRTPLRTIWSDALVSEVAMSTIGVSGFMVRSLGLASSDRHTLPPGRPRRPTHRGGRGHVEGWPGRLPPGWTGSGASGPAGPRRAPPRVEPRQAAPEVEAEGQAQGREVRALPAETAGRERRALLGQQGPGDGDRWGGAQAGAVPP